jgi:radical SAM-linked protein
MRTFHRALRRAGLPVRYTQGYNPRPRVVFPHALELGISSEDEPVEIELDGWVPPAEVATRLDRALPDGLDVREARLMPPRRRGSKAIEAHYEARLNSDEVDSALAGVERFMEAESWPLERPDHRVASGSFKEATRRGRVASGVRSGLATDSAELHIGGGGRLAGAARRSKRASRRIDLRPHVLALSVEGTALRMQLRLGQPGAARPREVVGAVLDRAGDALLDVPVRKTRTVLAGPA